MDRSADNLGQIINDIQRDLEELKTTQLRVREELYPIGSIYMSATLSTPEQVADIYGGVWEAWGSGKVPVGVDANDTDFATAGLTGGSKTHSHTLQAGYAKLVLKGNGQVRYQERTVATWKDNFYVPSAGSGGGGSDNQTYGANLDGSTDSGTSLQPYITCYMYRRVE